VTGPRAASPTVTASPEGGLNPSRVLACARDRGAFAIVGGFQPFGGGVADLADDGESILGDVTRLAP